MALLAFRCDGDDDTGAGHVSRCLRLAEAFRAGGTEVLFVGRHEGVAAELLTAAGLPRAEAGPGPLGVVEHVDAVVVDSYSIPERELEGVSNEVAVVALCDGERAPGTAVALSYHLDAPQRLAVPKGTVAVLGPAYAPVSPECLVARRPRDFHRVLASVGGGTAPSDSLREMLSALRRTGDFEVRVAGPLAAALGETRAPNGVEGLGWADAAVTAAGFSSYELACAGVPNVIVAVADNQVGSAAEFARHGLALSAGGPDVGHDGLSQAIEALCDTQTRERLAAAGPSHVDGYGAFRARDAIAAALSGSPLPTSIRYRPAGAPSARRLDFLVEEEGFGPAQIGFELSVSDAVLDLRTPLDRARPVRELCELVLASHRKLERVIARCAPGDAAAAAAFKRAGFRPAGEAGTGMTAFVTGRPRP